MDLLVFNSFFPEIFLSLTILFQLVFNAFTITNLKYNFPIIHKEIFLQTMFILFCLLFLLWNNKIEGYFLTLSLVNDIGSLTIKFFITCVSIFVLILVFHSFNLQKLNFFEYFSIYLLALLSLLLLISANDMIIAYLAVEMQALCFYILASFRRNSAFSTEAGLKYFIVGAFISSLFLFGCSLIYGILGTLNFNHLSLLLSFSIASTNNNVFLILLNTGILFILITFLFKLSAAPFHFWSPDVYEGAPLASTIVFSILPKFALLHFFIRWLGILNNSFLYYSDLLMLSGIASVFIGTFFAIRQKRLKRFVIYSSIAQIGFLVAALSQLSQTSIHAVYFFLLVYIITSILIWLKISLFYTFQLKISAFYNKALNPLFLSNLSNFFAINKIWAVSFILIFFSIAGIPPLSGFLAKIFILFSLILENQVMGALLIILISAISVFYYLRVLKIIFFESKTAYLKTETTQVIFSTSYFLTDCFLLAGGLFFLIFLFFYPSFFLLICQYISLSSFNF